MLVQYFGTVRKVAARRASDFVCKEQQREKSFDGRAWRGGTHSRPRVLTSEQTWGGCHGEDVFAEKERVWNPLAGDPNGQDLARGTASWLHEAFCGRQNSTRREDCFCRAAEQEVEGAATG